MNKIYFFLIISISIVFVQPVWAVEFLNNENIIFEKYEKQKKFICDKQEFEIPPYFSEISGWKEELYLTADNGYCKPDYFNVVLGKTKDCTGGNACIEASFSYSKVGSDTLEGIKGALSLYSKEIELDKNKNGYFIPSQCHAYCSVAKLIWFDYDKLKIFIISTKNPQNNKKIIDKLIKSANSYINQPNN